MPAWLMIANLPSAAASGHLLDLDVMGYQPTMDEAFENWQPLEIFAANLPYPIVLVGQNGPQSYQVNAQAWAWLEQLELPEGSWQLLQGVSERV